MTFEHAAMVSAAGGLSASEKSLLRAYADHSDAHGYCWPGVPRLVDETGMSRATIKRVNASLRAKGLIRSVHRINPKTKMQITNLTRINISLLASMRRPPKDYGDNLVEEITFDEDETPQTAFSQPARGAHHEPGGGLTMSPPGAHHEPGGGLTMSPKPSVEPSVEPSSSCAQPSQPPQEPRERAEEEGSHSGKGNGVEGQGVSEVAAAIVDRAVSEWAGHRHPTRSERARLAERAAAALAQGSTPEGVSWALTRDLGRDQVRTSAVQVVMSRTACRDWASEQPPAPASTSTAPPKCPSCNPFRRVEGEDGRDLGPCPTCHPRIAQAAQAS